jgi:hypothetical protein
MPPEALHPYLRQKYRATIQIAEAIFNLLSFSRSGRKGINLFLLKIKTKLKMNEMKKVTNRNCIMGISSLCAIDKLTQISTGPRNRRETGEKSTGG